MNTMIWKNDAGQDKRYLIVILDFYGNSFFISISLLQSDPLEIGDEKKPTGQLT